MKITKDTYLIAASVLNLDILQRLGRQFYRQERQTRYHSCRNRQTLLICQR